jgi:large-conductance mechanosensitive channel
MDKEEKKTLKKRAKLDNQGEKMKNLATDFKKFITKGNVLDMSVGVIMGSAFNAIVSAFTSILLSVCTWGVPGGLKGLVTVLPAANAAQAGVVGQSFASADIAQKTIDYAKASAGVTITADDSTFVQWQTQLKSLYTLHGTNYFYNNSAIIDWGTFLNAIITFLIIALTLFTIVKVASSVKANHVAFLAEVAKREHDHALKDDPELAKKEAEELAKKNAPAPKPENIVLLTEIRDSIKALSVKEAAK